MFGWLRREPKKIRVGIISAASVLVFGLAIPFPIYWLVDPEGPARLGEYGDLYAAFIAAGAGIAGTILFFCALLQQQEDLRLTTQIAKEQALALERQQAELAAQNTLLKEQTRLQQKRDDLELLLRLGEKSSIARNLEDADRDPFVLSGFEVIIRWSFVDRAVAQELTRCFLATCLGPALPSQKKHPPDYKPAVDLLNLLCDARFNCCPLDDDWNWLVDDIMTGMGYKVTPTANRSRRLEP